MITDLYRQRLKEIPGIYLVPALSPDIKYNHAYMPIEVDEQEFGMSRDALYEKLGQYNVHTRRYFCPLVCDYACYRNVSVKDPLTVARRVADRILTLPIYDSLQLSDVDTICKMIMSLQLGEDSSLHRPWSRPLGMERTPEG
jgi:dTDP-4-amino-4,6-dideoxygalactose transaminase